MSQNLGWTAFSFHGPSNNSVLGTLLSSPWFPRYELGRQFRFRSPGWVVTVAFATKLPCYSSDVPFGSVGPMSLSDPYCSQILCGCRLLNRWEYIALRGVKRERRRDRVWCLLRLQPVSARLITHVHPVYQRQA